MRALYAIALTLSITACTSTITRVDYVRVPCLPSDRTGKTKPPSIPTAEYGTDEHVTQYTTLLGEVAFVWKACDVPEISDGETDTGLIHAGPYGD